MKKISKKTVIIIASIFVIGLVGSLIPSDEPAPEPEKAKTEVAKPTGINQSLFVKNVNDAITSFNEQDNGFTFSYKVQVSGMSATVDLTFSDMIVWSYSNEADRKEFINIMGNSMTEIASRSLHNIGDTHGTTTRFYSPSGMLLGERTLFGKVKLY